MRTADLALAALDVDDVVWADRVAISVPMHTATRLADEVVEALSGARPELRVALYGLYADVGGAEVDARLVGEYEPGLLRWVGGETGATSRHIGRSDFAVPDRGDLPALGEYARLEHNGNTVVAGAVEASHGCRHRCRHCPIPAVYDGRMRIVPRDDVLSDIGNLVAAGAGHITFGDADFLNAPAHSLDILERAHAAHPEVTFDATIKVEHIVDHHDLWPHMAELNLLFVVSAFESVDDTTLEILDKGHTVAGMSRAIELTRDAGIHIRPTWLPFLPWTRPSDIADTFRFIADNQLVGATDPVQMSIKLLVPRGSLLEDHDAMSPHLTRYDEKALTWLWDFADPETAVLHKELATIAANGSDCGQETARTLEEMRQAVMRVTGSDLPAFAGSPPTPRLTESWFCCAEPTDAQSVSISIGPPG